MACKWQVEKDDYATKVLEKHWPNVDRCRDIREFRPGPAEKVSLLCGGFPCQDISAMGKGVGIDGERSGLWSEMFRTICEIRPEWIVIENVPRLTIRGLSRVLNDLARIGMDAEWRMLHANWFGSNTTRKRLFIVAYPNRWKSGQPHERFILLGKVPSMDAGREEPYTNRMRITQRVSDRVDIGKRISGIANAVVPQVAEWIGRQIMKSKEG